MSSSVDPASLLVSAAVPAFKCPAGTKMHILNLGTLQADESWFVFANGYQVANFVLTSIGSSEAAMQAP